MAHRKEAPIRDEYLRDFRYLRPLGPLLQRLPLWENERDRVGNRRLYYDQYVT